jgi:Fe-S cluster assembly protein SufD
LASPSWLAERREHAAQLTQTLELPQFKGKAGWEFTDISGLDLAALEPAPTATNGATATAMFEPDALAELRQVDGGEAELRGDDELPEGVIVAALDAAAEQHPDLVRQHLGTLVTDEDLFVARNDAGFRGGAFVYVPRGVVLQQPLLLTAIQSATGTELDRRTLIVLEEGAQAEVWEQYLSASDDTEGVFNTVTELIVART